MVSDGIGLQPKAAPLYFARGVLYVQLAEYEKGQADFEKAYELDPSQSLSSAAQGLAAAQENDLDRALAKVQASLARKPNDAILLYLQADILAQKGAEPGTPEFADSDALSQTSRRVTAHARSRSRSTRDPLPAGRDNIRMRSSSAARPCRAIPRTELRCIT